MTAKPGSTTRAGAILGAAGALAAPRIALAQDVLTIKVATLPNDTTTASLYADRSGMFRRAGLQLDLQVVRSGAAAAAAVAGGANQVGFSSLISLIEAHARGVPFTLLAPGGLHTSDVPYTVFIVRKEAPYKNAADLNGKTVAVQALKDLNNIALLAWMDQNGGDGKSLKFVELPLSAQPAAIVEGRIEGANSGSPFLQTALESGRVRTFANVFDGIAKRFLIGAYFAMEDWVGKNREAATRFSQVIREASVYCNGHRAETVPLVAAFSGIDEKIVSRMARVVFPEYLAASDMQPLIDIAVKYGAVDKSFRAQELISQYAARPRA
jgi:NitT/TauT family transport system substrate-binding protein